VSPVVPDRHRAALRRLRAYDARHRAELTRTLEELLTRRGHMGATAAALYVHPNTLRQRLTRIATVSGLDVRTEDWLTLEIALRLLRLEDALAEAAPPA
jgi:DNA-binding PucR family transcriptional regulator